MQLLFLSFLFLLIQTSCVASLISNGLFAPDLSGWQVGADGEVFAAASAGSQTPVAGQFAVLSTGPATFRGSAMPATAYLSQPFVVTFATTVAFRGTLTLLTDLFTGAPAGSLDEFAVEILPPSGPIITLFRTDVSNTGFQSVPDLGGLLLTPAGSQFAEYLPAQTINASVLLDPGAYSLRFRVMNATDSLFDSGMLIANVSLGPQVAVPEPSTAVIMAACVAGLWWRRRGLRLGLLAGASLLSAQIPTLPDQPINVNLSFPAGAPKESTLVATCDGLQTALGLAARAGTFHPASGATLPAGQWLEIRVPLGLNCSPTGSTVYYPGASGSPQHMNSNARPSLFFPARTAASAGWIVVQPDNLLVLPARGSRVHPVVAPGPQLPVIGLGATNTFFQYSGSDFSCYLNEIRYIQVSPRPDGAATPGLYQCRASASGYAFVRLNPAPRPAGACTPGAWYYDAQFDPSLGYQRCVPGLGLRPVQIDGQGYALTFESGAERYWIRGMHFRPLPSSDPSLDRDNDIAYQAGNAALSTYRLSIPLALVRIPSDAGNIVFEQCLFTAADYPTRGATAFFVSGRAIRVLNSHLEGFSIWTDRDRSPTLQATELAAFYLTDARDVILEDNFVQSAGLGFIASSDLIHKGAWVPSMNLDIVLRRNTFIQPEKYRLGTLENMALAPAHLKTGPNPDSYGLYYRSRQGVEFKRGHRVLIEGNLITGMYGSVQAAQAITIWSAPPHVPVPTSGPLDTWLPTDGASHVTIRNNVVYRTASGIQITGRQYLSNLGVRMIHIENNAVDGVDGNHNALAADSPPGNQYGNCFWLKGQLNEVALVNNSCAGSVSTIGSAYAATPPFLLFDDNPNYLLGGSTLTVTNNLAEKTNNPGEHYFMAYPPLEGEAGTCYYLLGGWGSCTPSFIRSNLFANLADNATPVGSIYSTNGNTFVQALLAADQWAEHGTRRSAAGDFRLMPQSTYRANGALAGFGGRPRGVQENLFQAAFPVPLDLIVSVGPGTLALNFLSNTAARCWAAVDQENSMAAVTAATNGGAGPQLLTFTGLAVGQRYRFVLQCGAAIVGYFTGGDTASVQFRPGMLRGVDANKIGSLNFVRATGSPAVRFTTTVSRSLCGPATYVLERRILPLGSFAPLLTGPTGGFPTTLTGPAGTVQQFRVRMQFSNACAVASVSNPVTLTY